MAAEACTWGISSYAPAELGLESDPKLFCNHHTHSYPFCVSILQLANKAKWSCQLSSWKALFALVVKSFIVPWDSTVKSSQDPRAVFTLPRPWSSWELMTETPSMSMGSQCRKQKSVWYACGCFELLRTHTPVFCSSCVSWGLVALWQAFSTPTDLRACYVSECFPLPSDLFTSQHGKYLWAPFQKPLNWCTRAAKLKWYFMSFSPWYLHCIKYVPYLWMPTGLLSIYQSRKYLRRNKTQLKSDRSIVSHTYYSLRLLNNHYW